MSEEIESMEWSEQCLRIMAQEAPLVGELLVEALATRGMLNVRFTEENGYLEVRWVQLLPTADDVFGILSNRDPMSPTENIVTRPKEHSTLDGT